MYHEDTLRNPKLTRSESERYVRGAREWFIYTITTLCIAVGVTCLIAFFTTDGELYHTSGLVFFTGGLSVMLGGFIMIIATELGWVR